jgi:integrase
VTRVTIAEYGAKRAKIRVFTDGDLARVQWRVRGKLRTESYPNTAAGRASAKAFAKGVADARLNPDAKDRIVVRELWNRFAEAEFPHFRPRTKILYKEYFSKWLAAWGSDFVVEETTLAMMHEFRAALGKQGLATNTVSRTIRTVKMVYAWAEANELIDRNRLHLYRFKVSRDERPSPPPEFSSDERSKVLAALDPMSATQWRAWVAATICATQGTRQTAVLHLQWPDVDEALGTLHWQPQWDKMGHDWTQPMRDATREALRVAREWRTKSGYEGPWVIPAGSVKGGEDTKRRNRWKTDSDQPYTIQSLWAALRSAQTRAGVELKKGRGGHSFRRTFAGDVNAETGDPALALLSIGDTDLRQANTYVQKRDERVKNAFERLDNNAKTAAEAATKTADQAADQEPKE